MLMYSGKMEHCHYKVYAVHNSNASSHRNFADEASAEKITCNTEKDNSCFRQRTAG